MDRVRGTREHCAAATPPPPPPRCSPGWTALAPTPQLPAPPPRPEPGIHFGAGRDAAPDHERLAPAGLVLSFKGRGAAPREKSHLKKSFKSKSHARQSQIINLIHQRVRAAYKNAKDPKVKARLKKAYDYAEKRKEASKRKTQRLNKSKKKK